MADFSCHSNNDSMQLYKMSNLSLAQKCRQRRLGVGMGVRRNRNGQKVCLPSTREVSKVTFAALRLPAGKFKPIFSSRSRNDRPPFFDLALQWRKKERGDLKLRRMSPGERAREREEEGGWGVGGTRALALGTRLGMQATNTVEASWCQRAGKKETPPLARVSPGPLQPGPLLFLGPPATLGFAGCKWTKRGGYVSFGPATTRNKLAVLGKLRHQQHLAVP